MPKKIVFPASGEYWDEVNNRFIELKEQTLVLEHSLISLSKWERKWKKPFLSTADKSVEEWIDYIKCMTINNVNDDIYRRINESVMREILEYIEDPMTATTFSNINEQGNGRHEIVTAELIYYNMFSFGIPIELEKWHLNSLMALIRVFSIKNGGQKKMSSSEAAAYQRAINESRRAKNHRR